MKKLGFLLMILFLGCNTPDAPDCFKATGNIIEKEVELAYFNKVTVYDKINLFITQGEEQKVLIKAGENLIEDVQLEVIDDELKLSEATSCNLFREYGTTNIYITIPDLNRIVHYGAGAIRSQGKLSFSHLTLASLNQEEDSEIYTNGQYYLELESENVSVRNDNIAKFFLSGTTTKLNAKFFNGDARLEAGDLIAQEVDIFHRGSNKMIVNPQQSIVGEIRSTGDVVSMNAPPVVEVESFYTGRLIFQ